MIVKPSTKADECDAINNFIATPDFDRLPERARKNVLSRRRGLEGERSTAHILDRHFYDLPDHVVLHDLRLPDGIAGFAQFDHLILSRFSRTAAVIEVKNYSGKLSKNEHDEWCVWYPGRKFPKDIPNPLAQAGRQKEVLRAWLKANRHDRAFETINAFVIIPPNCSIDRKKVHADVPIYKADNFIAAWIQFGGVTPLGKLFSSGVSAKTLHAIARQLASDHQEDGRSIPEKVGLRSRGDAMMPEAKVAGAQVVEQAAAQLECHGIGDDGVASGEGRTQLGPVDITNAPADPLVSNDHEQGPTVGSAKASDKTEVVPGIYERMLPDGRIAFLADGDDGAGDRLTLACQGMAQWNPRFRNWLTDAGRASTIRNTLLTTHHEQEEIAHGVGTR